MSEEVCRTCFTVLKANKYHAFTDKSNIPGYVTVEDALKTIVPNLNYEVVAHPVLCVSCFMVLQATIKFRDMCLNNEQKLLQYLEDMESSSIDLRTVVDREVLSNVINIDHDYIMKYKTREENGSENEIVYDKTEDLQIETIDIDDEPSNELVEFDVTDSIDAFTEFGSEILKLFWSEDCKLPIEIHERRKVTSEKKQMHENDKTVDIQEVSNASHTDINNTESRGSKNNEQKVTSLEKPRSKPVEIDVTDTTAFKPQDVNVSDENQDPNVIMLFCTKCTLKFEGYRKAALHAKNKHNCDRIICCKLCKKFFYTTKAYQVHNKYHEFKVDYLKIKKPKQSAPKKHPGTNNTFRSLCPYCGLTFCRQVMFNKHLKRHEEGTSVQCDVCNKPFYSTYRLKVHKLRHILHNNIKDGTDFLCDHCGKHFVTYRAFYHHQKSHIVEGEFKCTQCDKVFIKKSKLRDHMKSHSTERRYMCEMCGHQSKYPEAMRKHRKQHFFGVPVKKLRYKCPVCSKGFENASRMKLHVVTHTNSQPHQCELCGRRFNLVTNLKRHMLVHTGEKPYQCNFCGQRFTQKGTVKIHQTSTNCKELNKLKVNNKGAKKEVFECETCGKKFKLFYWLKIHQQKHLCDNTAACDVCGRNFSNKGNLRRHLLCHTGEKPYTCKLCGKSFRQKNELIVHTRRHTGEKPFKCNICDKAFADISEQRRHVRRHLNGLTRDNVKVEVQEDGEEVKAEAEEQCLVKWDEADQNEIEQQFSQLE